jgi:hypothetical protein
MVRPHGVHVVVVLVIVLVGGGVIVIVVGVVVVVAFRGEPANVDAGLVAQQ